MKTLEILLNIIGIVFTGIGVLFIWYRIKYSLRFEKNLGNNIFNFIIGAIWFPLSIESDDDNYKIEKKKRINLLLRTLYVLFIVIIIFGIAFSLLKGRLE